MLRRFSSSLSPPSLAGSLGRRTSLLSPLPSSSEDTSIGFSTRHSLARSFVETISFAAKSPSLSTGKAAHCTVFKIGLASNVFVATALLDLYSKCYQFYDAHHLFVEMPERNVVTWSTMIYCYSQTARPILSIVSLINMIVEGFHPSPSSMSSVIVACSMLEDRSLTNMLHCMVFKFGFCSNVVVATTLVTSYANCSDLVSARRVFDEMEEKNVITWTSLISAYCLDRTSVHTMDLIREMQRSDIRPNYVAYNTVLSSFSRPEDLRNGEQVHSLVIRDGLGSDSYILVTLLTMYSRCGNSKDFANASLQIPTWDLVSRNSVMSGFSHLGDGVEVLGRFNKLRSSFAPIDTFTLASALKAIGIISALEEGKKIQALVVKTGNDSDVSIQNGLVSAYAKSGAIEESKRLFFLMGEQDLISWNALISGCAQHGYCREAIKLFEDMRRSRVKPDELTFLSVLTACSHVGNIEKGLEYFYLMKDSSTAPGLKHYACVVDLLGRAGYLGEAEMFVNCMPVKPGISVYKALLSACRVHQEFGIARRAAKHLLELWPNETSTYVLLSEVFTSESCWDDAAQIRESMFARGLTKEPAFSLIND